MKIEKEFILREIAGDYVIIPTGKTTLELNGLITVNELGAFLWDKLQQEITREELINSVVAEYDIDRETVEKDVDEFLQELVKNRILEM